MQASTARQSQGTDRFSFVHVTLSTEIPCNHSLLPQNRSPLSIINHYLCSAPQNTHTHTLSLQWTTKKEENAEERRRRNSSTSPQFFLFFSLSLCFFFFPSLSVFSFRLANTHRFLFAASFQPRLERMHRYHTTLRRSKKTPLQDSAQLHPYSSSRPNAFTLSVGVNESDTRK